MLQRAAVGLVVAILIALVATRAHSLSRSGAVAAVLVGTAATAAGYGWGALLIVYFVASTALSRLGRARKEARTASVVAKVGARDAFQVVANGGIFAAAALLDAPIVALGALAAATSDTWATEIGTLIGGTPRSILTGKAVSAGTSGGVTIPGSLAMAAGASFVPIIATGLSLPRAIGIVTAAGIAGALADSLLGATLQERRWCVTCAKSSERRVHDCGTATTLAGGLEWMGNDVVNLAATAVGGVVAAALAAL
jgi:uncharacterized protein (TIGR00297 family)